MNLSDSVRGKVWSTGKFIYQVLPFILQYIISLRKDMKLSEFGYLPDTF